MCSDVFLFQIIELKAIKISSMDWEANNTTSTTLASLFRWWKSKRINEMLLKYGKSLIKSLLGIWLLLALALFTTHCYLIISGGRDLYTIATFNWINEDNRQCAQQEWIQTRHKKRFFRCNIQGGDVNRHFQHIFPLNSFITIYSLPFCLAESFLWTNCVFGICARKYS